MARSRKGKRPQAATRRSGRPASPAGDPEVPSPAITTRASTPDPAGSRAKGSALVVWARVLGDPSADPLDRLRALGRMCRYLDAVEDTLIETVRASGTTWGVIGAALDLTRQGARQRHLRRLQSGRERATRSEAEGRQPAKPVRG
jgi:hypothetical protein